MSMTILRYVTLCISMLLLCYCQPGIALQHMCHVQGTLFHDKFSAKSLEDARPELIYMEKMFLQHNPGVNFQSIQ